MKRTALYLALTLVLYRLLNSRGLHAEEDVVARLRLAGAI